MRVPQGSENVGCSQRLQSKVAAAAALVMNAGGNIGRSNAASDFGLRGEIAATAFYSTTLDEAAILSAKAVLNSRFGLKRAYSKRLVYGGSSLIFAQGTTVNRTPPRLMDLGPVEIIQLGISGLALASEYSNRATRDYGYFGTGKQNILVVDAPSND